MKKKNSDPQIAITASQVIAWSLRRWQQPTRAEADRWLSERRRFLQGGLRSLLAKHLDRLLDEAADDAYPDPRVDGQLKQIRNAIDGAAEAYGEGMDLEVYGDSVVEEDLLHIANVFSSERPANFQACVEVEHHFGPPIEDYLHATPTHHTRRVHIVVADGKMTVEMVRRRECSHGAEFFVPSGQRSASRS